MMGTCHCSRCRKAGAATFVLVRAGTFRWVRGRELVAELAPEPPFSHARRFCPRCGTALGEPDAGDLFPVNAHCLDDDPVVRNRFHEFVADKPAWHAIGDDAPRFAGPPPRPDDPQ